MAWNKSTPKSPQAGKGSKKRSLTLGAAILIAGALLSGGILWLRFNFSEPTTNQINEKGQKARLINDVGTNDNNHVTRKNTLEAERGRNIEYKKVGQNSLMKYIDGKPAWQYPREDYHGPVYTSKSYRVETIVDKTFTHEADKIIAELITLEPGEQIIGDIEFDEHFVKDFLKSYENPFITLPEDTEEQRALKHSVADVKGELRQRMDAGEDIAKVLTDARNQLRELAAYKEEITEMVEGIACSDAKSAEDIEDCVAAANKMLESRGIEPLKIKGILRSQIKRFKNSKENHE